MSSSPDMDGDRKSERPPERKIDGDFGFADLNMPAGFARNARSLHEGISAEFHHSRTMTERDEERLGSRSYGPGNEVIETLESVVYSTLELHDRERDTILVSGDGIGDGPPRVNNRGEILTWIALADWDTGETIVPVVPQPGSRESSARVTVRDFDTDTPIKEVLPGSEVEGGPTVGLMYKFRRTEFGELISTAEYRFTQSALFETGADNTLHIGPLVKSLQASLDAEEGLPFLIDDRDYQNSLLRQYIEQHLDVELRNHIEREVRKDFYGGTDELAEHDAIRKLSYRQSKGRRQFGSEELESRIEMFHSDFKANRYASLMGFVDARVRQGRFVEVDLMTPCLPALQELGTVPDRLTKRTFWLSLGQGDFGSLLVGENPKLSAT